MKIYDGDGTASADRAASNRRQVGIAEFDVVTSDAVLTSSGLGSCVGVALYDPVVSMAGLVHVMLPCRDDDEDDRAKYADSGIEALAEAMTANGADRSRLRAKFAGGSDMLDLTDDGHTIGRRNVVQVRETLSEMSIPVEAVDVGGDCGRSIEFDAATGELTVTSANQESTVL